MTDERYFPKEENMGHDCLYWNVNHGCTYPKMELLGRRSCEGIIDDVCLFIKDGRPPSSLSEEQKKEIKLRVPGFPDKSYLPPGDTS